ncbi:MAG: imidazole glycerol phosphate synthase subunit HisH [Alphaproteobacteria bacterium]|nr:imidazole glycerol phosphate synthase subunit HisH [Alphaproteobacteria bacterium]
MMIAMIDTGISNLSSVKHAIERIGIPVHTSANKAEVVKADALVLPGVGAFGEGIGALRKKGLIEPIRDRVLKDRVPILGICLGMQLLATTSEEHGRHDGLGLIAGHVTRLAPTEPGFCVPNIGWCDVDPGRDSVLFPKDAERRAFYHVHSYYLDCADAKDVAATIEYSGKNVPVAVERENVFGTQFHPEKSQDAGLDLLQRFFMHLQDQGRVRIEAA